MAGPPILIVAPTIVRYTFHHSGSTIGRIDNVVDVSIDPTDITETRDAAVDSFNSHICGIWQDNVLNVMSTVIHFDGASWIDLHTATGRTGTLGPAAGHPTVGGDPDAIGAMQVCALIHKHTTSARGSKPGRMYISPLSENVVQAFGQLTSGKITSLTTQMNHFRDAIIAAPTTDEYTAAWRVVHVHKPDKNDSTTWTWSSSDVTSCSCDPVVATQRRRQRK